MVWMKRTLVLVLALCASGSNVSAEASQTAEQITAQRHRMPLQAKLNLAQAPSGSPGRRRPLGKQGDAVCPIVQTPITALAPLRKTNDGTSVVWGLMDADKPMFWFYLPYSLTSEHPGQFHLEDEQGNQVAAYKPLITKGTQSGVVGVRLPKLLKQNTNYLWKLEVTCKNPATGSPETQSVLGWVQWVKPDAPLAAQLKKATLRDQAKLYANSDILFSTLTVLAELRQAKPKDTAIAADWSALLQAWKLDELSSQPVVETISLEEVK